MSLSIRAGGLLILDPSDKRVLLFQWGTEALPVGVTIATSTFTITAIGPVVGTLTKDAESIPAGNRTTQLRLDATTATVGDRYALANKVVTSEVPAQTLERQCVLLIQHQ